MSKNVTPLGYVKLGNELKAIYPMNDIFLNYTFEEPANWEALRLIVNLLIDEYSKKKLDTKIKPIGGNIKVRTQFRHLLKADEKTTRDQDIKVTEDEDTAIYIEFQNKAGTQPPIEVRSVEYFGLGIGHSKGKIANQMWLLAEDVNSVLHGEPFTRYILNDEITGNVHPNASGIMYVSLVKLSRKKSPAGELASFLLGMKITPENENVREVTKVFSTSFDAFKADKEVVGMLSLAERYRNDGIIEGEAKGKAEGKAEGKVEGIAEGSAQVASNILELIEQGIDPKKALHDILNKYDKQKQSD